jgi:cardiolipin synthase
MWKKRVADGLSLTRFFLALSLVWLGFSQGAAGLSLAVAVLLAAWITDVLDGPLARSSGVKTQTWIGSHDLHIDVAMSTAALIYLNRAGFVDGRVVAAYLFVWAIIFWRLSNLPKSFGALFQAPIYAWFIWTSLQQAPEAGRWLVLYVVVYVASGWKLLIHRLIPEFFRGVQEGLTRVLPRAEGRGRRGTDSLPGCGMESPVDGQQPGDTMQIPR